MARQVAADVSELWLDELATLTSHVLHDLRNGLQGVGINIEVIKSRSVKAAPVTPASELAVFAVSAARQFDDVSRRVESLVSLCRNPRGEADLVPVLQALSGALKSGSAEPLLLRGSVGYCVVGVGLTAARLVLTHVALCGVRSGATVECEVVNVVPATVRLEFGPADGLTLMDAVTGAADALHIRIDRDTRGITVTFPTTLRSDTVLV